jgi:hypothetical protein
MRMINHKARAEQLASELQRSISDDALKAKELIQCLYEDAKDRMVSATGETLVRTQGEAWAYQRLYDRMTRKLPNAKKEPM